MKMSECEDLRGFKGGSAAGSEHLEERWASIRVVDILGLMKRVGIEQERVFESRTKIFCIVIHT